MNRDTNIIARVPIELKKKLIEIAQSDNRTLSNQVFVILDNYVKEQSK